MMRCRTERLNRVTAVYRDAELSFDMARGATLAQLAERVCMLGEGHDGLPVTVNVRATIGAAA